MQSSANRQLIEINLRWLRQALQLIGRLDDVSFSAAPQMLPDQRAGSHLRHILEFYECFLDGVETSRVDYDARKRDELVERSRAAAADRIRALAMRLDASPRLLEDRALHVRIEDSQPDGTGAQWVASCVSRELQVLSSHTIHHFALIAMVLKCHGVRLDADFGMSPSTLRFHASRGAASLAEGA